MTPAAVRKIALALPDSVEALHFELTSFRVRGKIFATMPPDGAVLRVFVGDAIRDQALLLHADCCTKLLWGGKVVGIEADLPRLKGATAKWLLQAAWRDKAPRALVDETLPGRR